MVKMFSREPQQAYWKRLFDCIDRRRLHLVGVASDSDLPDSGIGYLGCYTARTGVIEYLSELSDEDKAMVLTHEVFHAVIRQPSPDAEKCDEHAVPSEERTVNRASSLICDHFELGDYYAAMRVQSVRHLEEPTPDELARATLLADLMITELEKSP
jgi:hypothetical protein